MELHIGDVIRAAFGNPVDAIAAAVAREDAIAEQVRPPTDNEKAAIEKIAAEAAALQDEIADLMGDRGSRLSALRKDLTGKMIRHGLKELKIAGRPAIELANTSSRKPTRKAIVAALQKAYVEKLGEKDGMKEGKLKAFALWNSLAPTPGVKLTIPAPVPESDEVEPSY
jgi:hypothetical protein